MKIVYQKCTNCNELKTLSEYYKLKNGKNGVMSKCKICHKEKTREHAKTIDNSEKQKLYYLNNKDKFKNKYKEFKSKNPTYYTSYYKNNKEKINKNRRIWAKNKRNTDSMFKLKHNIRCMIVNAFKNNYSKKANKTLTILGCDFKTLKKHIENQFDNNMNWNNYAIYWEIDHIKPISLATTYDMIVELSHYTNLQPLEKTKNRIKSNNYE